MVRRRLDAELVRRHLAGSAEEAGALVAAGRVTVGGAPALNPGRQVDAGEAVAVATPAARFVSRGGEKLEAAVERFGLAGDIAGARALDAGASTGGFTDCLLQHGAASVVAVDVGYGQLHERLRADPRVEVRDRTNVREADLGERFDVVVADLSFISLALVLPALLRALKPGGPLVLLAKPQFEAPRDEVDRGRGVIRDPAVWRRVLAGLRDAICDHGAAIMDAMVSPLRGADGNVEFLLLVRSPGDAGELDIGRLVEEASG
jgi:23S rRNA (cytidine1920-2'-O)/16S rRNA (cytidine1409-2'-O)-methyltransferase